MKYVKKNLYHAMCVLFFSLSTAQADTIQWLNHFELLSGKSNELMLSTNSTSSGVGGGLTGVVVKSTSTGDVFSDGGNKVVQMALNMSPQPAGINIRGVRICYESTNAAATYITQTRIVQVMNPPSTATVKMDDDTNLTTAGANCVTVSTAGKTNIVVGNGPLLLSLRFLFGSINDAIVIRGLGIVLG